jgi:hypothetical protein
LKAAIRTAFTPLAKAEDAILQDAWTAEKEAKILRGYVLE